MTIERALKTWRAESNGKQDNRISQIIGIYHRNMARLSITIHCSQGNKTTLPIKESILRAVYDQLDDVAKDTVLLQCFGGERYTALNLLSLSCKSPLGRSPEIELVTTGFQCVTRIAYLHETGAENQ